MKRFAILFIVIILMAACSPAPKNRFAETGLFDEHRLARDAVSGNYLTGNFSAGSVVDSTYHFHLRWEAAAGDQADNVVPIGKVRIVTDDAAEVPTVKFNFDRSWLDMAHQYFYNDDETVSARKWELLVDEYLDIAVIRMPGNIIEEEDYIPKVESK